MGATRTSGSVQLGPGLFLVLWTGPQNTNHIVFAEGDCWMCVGQKWCQTMDLWSTPHPLPFSWKWIWIMFRGGPLPHWLRKECGILMERWGGSHYGHCSEKCIKNPVWKAKPFHTLYNVKTHTWSVPLAWLCVPPLV